MQVFKNQQYFLSNQGIVDLQCYINFRCTAQIIFIYYICNICACSVTSNSLQPYELQPNRLFCPWDFPGKNSGVGGHLLLQRILLTQGLNSHVQHCRRILYLLSHQGIIPHLKSNKDIFVQHRELQPRHSYFF